MQTSANGSGRSSFADVSATSTSVAYSRKAATSSSGVFGAGSAKDQYTSLRRMVGSADIGCILTPNLLNSPGVRGTIAQRPCGPLGLAIEKSVDKPANHSLVPGAMLCSLRIDELDALLAQRQGYLHTLFTKCQFGRRREEVGNHLNLPEGFIGVFDFRAHRSPFLCANDRNP